MTKDEQGRKARAAAHWGAIKAKRWFRPLIALVVLAVIILVLVLISNSPAESYQAKYTDILERKEAEYAQDLAVLTGQGETEALVQYREYSKPAHWGEESLKSAAEPIEVDVASAAAFVTADGVRRQAEIPALSGAAPESAGTAEARAAWEEDGVLYTASGSFVGWEVEVPETALYNILIEYRAPESRGVEIERSLYVGTSADDLAIPFDGARSLTFYRTWTDGEMDEAKRIDNQGNQRRPRQVEVHSWQKAYVKDAMGYEVNPYAIRLAAGRNVIALEAVNEPMEIRGITLTPVLEYPTYEAYVAEHADKQDVTLSDKSWHTVIQGEGLVLERTEGKDADGNTVWTGKVTEDSKRRSSSPSLYARYDRSSSATEPSDVYHTVFNYVGGDPWNSAGQWIEWSFAVPEDGWYNITLKARQNHQRGALSCRSLYIDGEIPFDKMATVSFNYNNAWELLTLSDDAGTPYRFWLEAGEHTVRLEATLGEMGPILQDMKNSLDRLNRIYRRVLVLTGVNPDRFRDYKLEEVYPEVIKAMELESMRLYKLVDDTVAITGQKSDRVAVAQTLAVQLEGFVNHTERITQVFANFKDNITSLGTAMQNMSETKLDIDLIIVSGEDYTATMAGQGFFSGMGHELSSLAASYTVDYDSLGDKYTGDDVLDVWITTGRDQSTVLKSLIDQEFTDRYGVHVNVKLVVADTLLTAVVAGNGPDVALSLGSWFPVNYAMRDAAEAMDQFDAEWVAANYEPDENGKYPVKTYEEVVADYYGSALEPFTYIPPKDNTPHVYAIPETQEFAVVFYRTDVLAEYGIGPEDLSTWDDIIALLPTIQGNNLSVGVPYPDITNPDMSVLNSLIYQYGGQIYDERVMHTEIDRESGVAAFKLYTSLYNDYGLPTVYDFVSRFRTGEMPIGVANYSMYNTLAVSAPEIRGLWDFTYFPGTLREDEEIRVYNTGEIAEDHIDRTVHAQGLCSMIISTDDPKVKKNAWTFLQWWTDADTQVSFGREMESVLGSSARYTTANKRAMPQLGWSDAQLEVLQTQMAWTRGFPEIAGGYSTTRHMTNAVRRVINTKEDARETLLTYTKTINEEIKIKRQEFGLPTTEEELAEQLAAQGKPAAAAPAADEAPASDQAGAASPGSNE